ncbi:MAG: hypothetical protein ACRDWV_04480 [Acidimicrobiales bacterium]
MSTRYLSNALVTLLGGLVVVTSLTLAAGPSAWIGFGIGLAVVVVSLLAQLDRSRGLAQRGLDTMVLAASTTMIVVSLVLAASTVVWVMFALALGFVALGMTSLTLHEVFGWRSEHGLGELHWLENTARPEHHRSRRDNLAA